MTVTTGEGKGEEENIQSVSRIVCFVLFRVEGEEGREHMRVPEEGSRGRKGWEEDVFVYLELTEFSFYLYFLYSRDLFSRNFLPCFYHSQTVCICPRSVISE